MMIQYVALRRSMHANAAARTAAAATAFSAFSASSAGAVDCRAHVAPPHHHELPAVQVAAAQGHLCAFSPSMRALQPASERGGI